MAPSIKGGVCFDTAEVGASRYFTGGTGELCAEIFEFWIPLKDCGQHDSVRRCLLWGTASGACNISLLEL